MSTAHPIQLDLFDHESAQGETQPSAAVVSVSAGKGSINTLVVALSSAATEAKQPCVATATVAMRETDGTYLSDVAVAARYAVSRPTIWRWTKTQCGFPQPTKLSSGTTRWRLEDLQRYELARRLQQDHAIVTKNKGGAA